MDLKNAINEIQRKIGRNLLLIQKMEYLLKYFVLHSNISGNLSQLKDIKKTRHEKLSKMSMGQVLPQYLNHINPSKENNQEIPNFKSDIHISIEWNYDLSKEEFEKKENLFSDILKERNDLVHHLIPDFNESSIKSCKDLEYKLDEQKNRLLAELKHLQAIIKAIQKAHNRFKEYSESGFFEKALYYDKLLNDQLLILELAKLSMQNDELDGWISLGFAGIHIRNIIPEEVNKLKDKYGYKTLKPLIQNTKMFELKEDTNKNMFLYRLTADWKQYLRQINTEYIEGVHVLSP